MKIINGLSRMVRNIVKNIVRSNRISLGLHRPRFLLKSSRRLSGRISAYTFMTLMIAGFLLGTFFICLLDKQNRVALMTAAQLPAGVIKIKADAPALLFYLIMERCRPFLIIALLSFTILGVVIPPAYALWMGASLGIMHACLVITYGLRGTPLFFALTLPHFLFIIPLAGAFLKNCFEICAILYYPKIHIDTAFQAYRKKPGIWKRSGILVLLFIGFMSTCVLEIYVNGKILTFTEKFFM